MRTRIAALTVVTVLAGAGVASAETRVVGTGCGTKASPRYRAIQTAVDASAAGDKLIVCDGTYTERVAVTVPDLELRSNRPYGAVIQAPKGLKFDDDIVEISSSSVTFADFAIRADAGQHCVEGVCGVTAVRVQDGATRARVTGNWIEQAESGYSRAAIGIDLGSYDARTSGSGTVADNLIVLGGRDGTGIELHEYGDEATVTDNALRGGQYGLNAHGHGIHVEASGNTVSGATEAAFRLSWTDGNLLAGNLAVDSAIGFHLDTFAERNVVQDNDAIRNDVGFLAGDDATVNTFTGNRARSSHTADCRDMGSANTWLGNIGATAMPAGICTGG